jgi:hypothetical protein
VTMYAPRQYGMDFRNDNPSQTDDDSSNSFVFIFEL